MTDITLLYGNAITATIQHENVAESPFTLCVGSEWTNCVWTKNVDFTTAARNLKPAELGYFFENTSDASSKVRIGVEDVTVRDHMLNTIKTTLNDTTLIGANSKTIRNALKEAYNLTHVDSINHAESVTYTVSDDWKIALNAALTTDLSIVDLSGMNKLRLIFKFTDGATTGAFVRYVGIEWDVVA